MVVTMLSCTIATTCHRAETPSKSLVGVGARLRLRRLGPTAVRNRELVLRIQRDRAVAGGDRLGEARELNVRDANVVEPVLALWIQAHRVLGRHPRQQPLAALIMLKALGEAL